MSLLGNERTKLLANALDRASTACFTVGVATPLAAWVYDLGALRAALSAGSLVLGISGWLGAVVVLHMSARRVLVALR